MSQELLTDLTVFVLSLLVGFEVISKVPATLHTPLMSAANAVHGVILVGAMLIAVSIDTPAGYLLGFVAAAFAAMNVVGGYVVTDRMLHMFRDPRRRNDPTADATAVTTSDSSSIPGRTDSSTPGKTETKADSTTPGRTDTSEEPRP